MVAGRGRGEFLYEEGEGKRKEIYKGKVKGKKSSRRGEGRGYRKRKGVLYKGGEGERIKKVRGSSTNHPAVVLSPTPLLFLSKTLSDWGNARDSKGVRGRGEERREKRRGGERKEKRRR